MSHNTHSLTRCAALIMAGGLGTRMKCSGAKTMQLLAGRPLIEHILDLCEALGLAHVVVITNPKAVDLSLFLQSQTRSFPIQVAEQPQALGTAHAVSCGLAALERTQCSHVLILSGDVPNLRAQTILNLVQSARDGVGVLTAVLEDACSYGRIIRDAQGRIQAIVEAKDCSAAQLGVREINTGIYYVPMDVLVQIIPRIGNNNKAGEYYLTDLVQMGGALGVGVYPCVLGDAREGAGINTQEELLAAQEFHLQER